jgi:hypothetical protein
MKNVGLSPPMDCIGSPNKRFIVGGPLCGSIETPKLQNEIGQEFILQLLTKFGLYIHIVYGGGIDYYLSKAGLNILQGVALTS